MFNDTLPDFACGPEKGPVEHAAVLSEHFDAIYTKSTRWFMQGIEKLGNRFLG